MVSRFFLFHASLVVALAIIGHGESPEVPKWQADIEMVRNMLHNVLGGNQLAARCADILNYLLPLGATAAAAGAGGDFGATGESFASVGNPFDPATMDFFMWPADQQGDIFASLG